jgi:threonyl-tRNA synthetase
MKKETVSLFDIRSAVACLLAVAVKQRFPSCLQAGMKVTPLGFYCDFSFSEAFDPQYLKLIEEVMQAWIRQKLSMRIREMVALSAREYFLFHKEPLLADFIEDSSSSSFFLAEIAGQTILSESDVALGDLGKIGAFSLQKSEQVGSKLRIYGTAFFDKKELKDFLKLSEDWEFSSHTALGKKLKFFEETEEGEWIWYPAGQKARSILKRRIEKEEEDFGFLKVSSMPVCEEISLNAFSAPHQKIFEQQKISKITECATFCLLEGKDGPAGLLNPSIFQGIRSHVFCSRKDLSAELISYLHFMTKIFKILGFAFRPILFEAPKGKFKDVSSSFSKALESFDKEVFVASDGIPRIQWDVIDGLARSWQVACVTAIRTKQEEFTGFACSSCLSFERVFALLLEKEKGTLPFWISPVQVKVVPLLSKHKVLAEKTVAALKCEGMKAEICREGVELKTTLRRALEEGVPYVVVIGDKELETDTITLRDVRAKFAQSLPWQELIKMLKIRN